MDLDTDTDTDTDESGRQLRELDYDFGQGKDGLMRKKEIRKREKKIGLSFCTF